VVSWADEHPTLVTGIVAVSLFVALRAWSIADDDPVLLARTDPGLRASIYSQFAGSAAALVGISLTVLAILLALPDRPSVADIRESDTWPRLRSLLLAVALLALVTMVTAHVATGVDTGKPGLEWLEQVIMAASITCALAMLAAGITFALLLYAADQPADPSEGRGLG
jgi:hypothetical protein